MSGEYCGSTMLCTWLGPAFAAGFDALAEGCCECTATETVIATPAANTKALFQLLIARLTPPPHRGVRSRHADSRCGSIAPRAASPRHYSRAHHQAIRSLRRRRPFCLPQAPGVFPQVRAEGGITPALASIVRDLHPPNPGSAIIGHTRQFVTLARM